MCVYDTCLFLPVVLSVWGLCECLLLKSGSMGSVTVSSCKCCMFVSCGHPVAVLNAGRGCKSRPYGRGILHSRSHDCIVGSHECLLLFTPSCCCDCFYYL